MCALFGTGNQTRRGGLNRIAVETDTAYDVKGQSTLLRWRHSGEHPMAPLHLRCACRPLTETAPDNSVTSTAYHGLDVTVTNAEGQVNKRKTNVRSELSRVTDADNRITNYVYDPFGNLVKVIVDVALG